MTTIPPSSELPERHGRESRFPELAFVLPHRTTLLLKIKNFLGNCTSIPSGVPQGSVLGPHLFAAYIGCKLRFKYTLYTVWYVDDVTLIESVSSPDDVLSQESIVTKFYSVGLRPNP